MLVGHLAEEADHVVLQVVHGALAAVAQEVEAHERRNGDEQAGRGGDEHFADGRGELRGVADAAVPRVSKALIMPMTVPSRPIIGVHTPMTER